MKYLFLMLTLLCIACGECDQSSYYQVIKKAEDGASPALCRYEVHGIGACASWQSRQVLHFTDSCSKFPLSKILTRAQVESYNGNQGSVPPGN
jgi:hypothetical protein